MILYQQGSVLFHFALNQSTITHALHESQISLCYSSQKQLIVFYSHKSRDCVVYVTLTFTLRNCKHLTVSKSTLLEHGRSQCGRNVLYVCL
jgi:hypothetical protein